MAAFSLGAKARAAGYRLAGYDSIGSTNTEALRAATAGDPGGIWFCALQQTEGRGRRGRPWASAPGNLAATLLLVPEADPGIAATLGFVAGVALNQALAGMLPGARTIALKWPNDVLADGAKLAGILLEAHKLDDGRHAVAIGFGVNIVAAPKALPYPAVSLADLGSALDAAAVFEALGEFWVDGFALWRDGLGIGEVLTLWRQMAAGIGAPVAVSQNGAVVRGIFETIDDSGRLIVRADNDERVAITAGDVHFGGTASVAG